MITMNDTTTRVLGAARQSKTRDRSVSLPTQRKGIQGWTDTNSGTLVKITTDASTSGGTSAFSRDGLGPYLTEPDKIAAWDVLVTAKLDRACRDVVDYINLRTWCDQHRKRFVILNQPLLDNGTPEGRVMGTVIAAFAQFEREMDCERAKERYDALMDAGRWPGGRLPYGFRYESERGELVPDDGRTADVLREMAAKAIDGKSYGQVAAWLNGGNGSVCHLTMIRRAWRVDTVRRVLRSPNTARLLGEARAAELRAALRKREQTRGERVGGHMLLRVAYCRTCQAPLYAQKKNRPSGGYYRCLNCRTCIRMDKLEQQVEACLLFVAGSLELTERKLVPGDDHQTAIHALERDVDALEKITGTETVIEAKRAEIAALRALPFAPDHYEPVPQGITVADHWAALDAEGRGSFLRKRGVRVFAGRTSVEFHGGWLIESESAEGWLFPL